MADDAPALPAIEAVTAPWAGPPRAFQVAAAARAKYGLGDGFFAATGPLVVEDAQAAQELAGAVNHVREAPRFPERAVRGSDLAAAALIQEILRHVVILRAAAEGREMADAAAHLEQRLGSAAEHLLAGFAEGYPSTPVYRGERTAEEHLRQSTAGVPNTDVALEELIMLRLANENPAFTRFRELHDDGPLEAATAYERAIAELEGFFAGAAAPGAGGASLFDTLRAPMRSSPTSLAGQLEYIKANWAGLLGERFAGLLHRILRTQDLLAEERVFRQADKGPPPIPDSATLAGPSEYEHFSEDRSWMPRVVLIAKSTYVWLEQLARRHGREVRRLDQVPDEELDALAAAGFTGLWLIGVWERSEASRRIKHLRGSPDAVASAYALYDYQIAADLGGQAALEDLRRRAAARGLRLASDMVPNHVGIDGLWVMEHPDWFLSLPHSPYPGYTYTGPDLSADPRVAIQIEDHYWDGTDAAVVFRRHDRFTGEDRFIYHGNDGTSMPWNDTAQLNYLLPEVREAVIRTILHVARLFPIIRFDSAMTLARQHVQRLWFPAAGTGGAVPSRAAAGMTDEEFARRMPDEFWRDVVDRVADEVPDTLLLAEAFWMLEGYFVRTLGMHRVYNSAFMHMTAAEHNADYRRLMRNVLGFDPEILKRYVNFMSNPDEDPATAQFGSGDKYFGVCTLMCTMPGLPMFGHGQVEGLHERYGMEYRRARWEEQTDEALVARHRREIFPLLHRRRQFAEAADFLLYDVSSGGEVQDDVYAYSNRVEGRASLVVYNNRLRESSGWIHRSVPYLDKRAGGQRTRHLGEGLGLRAGYDDFVVFRDHVSGLEHLRRSRDLCEQGLHVRLGGYQYHVFLDFTEVADSTGAYATLARHLAEAGVPSVAAALDSLRSEPLRAALYALVEVARPMLAEAGESPEAEVEAALGRFLDEAAVLGHPVDRRRAFAQFPIDLGVMAQTVGALDDRPPEGDRGWLVVWCASRLFPVGRGPLRLEEVALEGTREWARAISIAERHSAAIRDWGKSRGSAGGLRRLLADLVADAEVAALLRVHEYEGIAWFDRDGFRGLGRALVVAGLLGTRSKAVPARARELAVALARAEDRSGYRLERLLAEPRPGQRGVQQG